MILAMAPLLQDHKLAWRVTVTLKLINIQSFDTQATHNPSRSGNLVLNLTLQEHGRLTAMREHAWSKTYSSQSVARNSHCVVWFFAEDSVHPPGIYSSLAETYSTHMRY